MKTRALDKPGEQNAAACQGTNAYAFLFNGNITQGPTAGSFDFFGRRRVMYSR